MKGALLTSCRLSRMGFPKQKLAVVFTDTFDAWPLQNRVAALQALAAQTGTNRRASEG
jgi:hypothetical protein